MKKFAAGLLVLASFLLFTTADGQTKVKPYKWVPISGVMIHGAKAYMDIYSLRSGKTDRGDPYNTATLLTSYDAPLTVTGSQGTQKTGSSVISHVVIDCTSGTGGAMSDFLLVEKMPTKESVPIASKKYPPTPDNTFHLEKDSPLRAVLCPAEI